MGVVSAWIAFEVRVRAAKVAGSRWMIEQGCPRLGEVIAIGVEEKMRRL